ncbi:MAG: hypothetical protein Q8P67_09515, partial [archaeon]|nr:hypothetical protein [archaeon]
EEEEEEEEELVKKIPRKVAPFSYSAFEQLLSDEDSDDDDERQVRKHGRVLPKTGEETGSERRRKKRRGVSKEELEDLRDSIKRMDGRYWTGGSLQLTTDFLAYEDVYQRSFREFHAKGMRLPAWFRLFRRHWVSNERLRTTPFRHGKMRWFHGLNPSMSLEDERSAAMSVMARMQQRQNRLFAPQRRKSADRHDRLALSSEEEVNEEDSVEIQQQVSSSQSRPSKSLSRTTSSSSSSSSSTSRAAIGVRSASSSSSSTSSSSSSSKRSVSSLSDFIYDYFHASVSSKQSLLPPSPPSLLPPSSSPSSRPRNRKARNPQPQRASQRHPAFIPLTEASPLGDAASSPGDEGEGASTTIERAHPMLLSASCPHPFTIAPTEKFGLRSYPGLVPKHAASLAPLLSPQTQRPPASEISLHFQESTPDLQACLDAYLRHDHLTAQRLLFMLSAWFGAHFRRSEIPLVSPIISDLPLPLFSSASSASSPDELIMALLVWSDRLRAWLDQLPASNAPHEYLAQATLLLLPLCTIQWLLWVRNGARPADNVSETDRFSLASALQALHEKVDERVSALATTLIDFFLRAFLCSSGFFGLALPLNHHGATDQNEHLIERPFPAACLWLANLLDSSSTPLGGFWQVFNDRFAALVPSAQLELHWEILYHFASLRVSFDRSGTNQTAAPSPRGSSPANWLLLERIAGAQLTEFDQLPEHPRNEEYVRVMLDRVLVFSRYWVLSDNKLLDLFARRYFVARGFHDDYTFTYSSKLSRHVPGASLEMDVGAYEKTPFHLFLHIFLRRVFDIGSPIEATRLSSLFLIQLWDLLPVGPLTAGDDGVSLSQRLSVSGARNVMSLILSLVILSCRTGSFPKQSTLLLLRMRGITSFETSSLATQRELIKGYLICARILKLHGHSLQDICPVINECVAPFCHQITSSSANPSQRAPSESFLVDYFNLLREIFDVVTNRLHSAEFLLLHPSTFGTLLARFSSLPPGLKVPLLDAIHRILHLPEPADPQPSCASDDLDDIFSMLDEEQMIKGKFFEEQLSIHVCSLPLMNLAHQLSPSDSAVIAFVAPILGYAFASGIRFRRVGYTVDALVQHFGLQSRWYHKATFDPSMPLHVMAYALQLALESSYQASSLPAPLLLGTWLLNMMAPRFSCQRRFTLLLRQIDAFCAVVPMVQLFADLPADCLVSDEAFFEHRLATLRSFIRLIPADFTARPGYSVSREQHALSPLPEVLNGYLRPTPRPGYLQFVYAVLGELFHSSCISSLHSLASQTSIFTSLVSTFYCSEAELPNEISEASLCALFHAFSHIPLRIDSVSLFLQVLELQAMRLSGSHRSALSMLAEPLLSMPSDSSLFASFWHFLLPACLQTADAWGWSIPLLHCLIKHPRFLPAIDLKFVTYSLLAAASKGDLTLSALHALIRLAYDYCLLEEFASQLYIPCFVTFVILKVLEVISPSYPNHSFRQRIFAPLLRDHCEKFESLRIKIDRELQSQNPFFLKNARAHVFMPATSTLPDTARTRDAVLISNQVLLAHLTVESKRDCVRAFGAKYLALLVPVFRSFEPATQERLQLWEANNIKFFAGI